MQKPDSTQIVARDNNLEPLRLCKKYDVSTILGSDAHITFQIAFNESKEDHGFLMLRNNYLNNVTIRHK